jgi:hypothetical protein
VDFQLANTRTQVNKQLRLLQHVVGMWLGVGVCMFSCSRVSCV